MAGIDINRTTTNVINDPEISSEIWGKAIEESFFMQHARRITIPGPGIKVQTITGEPTANWVDETGDKPVSNHTLGKKTIVPYKLAVIEAFSMEFLRDADALYAELVRRLPLALGTKFDQTIMGTTAPDKNLFQKVSKKVSVTFSGCLYSRFCFLNVVRCSLYAFSRDNRFYPICWHGVYRYFSGVWIFQHSCSPNMFRLIYIYVSAVCFIAFRRHADSI